MSEWGKDTWPSGTWGPPASEWPTIDLSKDQAPLVAKKHCCEEASTLSHNCYIPCNAPAVNIVGWIGRSDTPIRMCQFCSNHNVFNRGGYIVGPYAGVNPAPKSQTQLPVGSASTTENQWTNEDTFKNPSPSSPYDGKSEDELLLAWDNIKKAIETAKAQEMELRKYIVNRAFPKKEEGMNNKELGNGYTLKAGVKYNYNLADNDTVENCLAKVASLGNQGPFIADRLVSWKPAFLLTEYRQLEADKQKGDKFAIEVLKAIEPMLTISEAAPSLEIKSPKDKKK